MMKKKALSTTVALNSMCRSCLSEKGHLKHIFSSSISKMIEFCMSTSVNENDKLPNQICVSCYHYIAKFYYFKRRFEKVDRFLKRCVKKVTEELKHSNEIYSEGDEINDEIKKTDRDSANNDDAPLPITQIQNDKSKLKNNTIIEIETDNKLKTSDACNSEDAGLEIAGEVIIPSDPPPLVLLPPKVNQASSPSFENKSRKLPKDPPPLALLTSTLPIQPKSIEIPLQCSICSETFANPDELKQHRINACQSAMLYCNVCKKPFTDRKRLIGHLKGHIISKDYECKLCHKRYPNPSTFRVHFRSHTGERPFKCQICGKGFARYAGVIGHMRIHSSEKPYQCSICERSFKVPSNLERHKTIHMRDMPFCCNYCGKTFNQLNNLELHIRSCHTNERPYLCSACGKGFVSSNRLNRHMWVHTGYKPYKCKYCTKAYTNSNDLKNHQKSHAGGVSPDDKPFACSQCNLRFFHKCRLLKHMKVHDKRFACTDCFKVFSSEALLKRHKGKHKKAVENNEKSTTNYPVLMFMVE
ncbi:zinc finger protein OZF-like isoform X2 [Agrilus planipennis]|uniref:Zinc finger protein OZF-like isoform X2 n=1 Tax=Agrilus planipennis TaxID=224129 RepID=A0A1W4W8Y9_AGRPL|nr:zinc finger protein OZF-like isoform X2 [Agrilus planipennis]